MGVELTFSTAGLVGRTGWKLEELQSKLQTQNAVLKSLVSTLHTPFLAFVGSLRGGEL